MALPDYPSITPGISIRQNLTPTAAGAAEEISVVAVGPKYWLSRYGKETTALTGFNAAGQTLIYQRVIDSVVSDLSLVLFSVDLASVKVHGVNLEAQLATFTAAGNPSFTVPVLSSPHELKITSGAVKGTSLATNFRGRSSAAGDIVVVTPTNGATPFKRKITGFRGTRSAGSYGSNAAANNSDAGNNSSNPIESTASAAQVSAPTGWSITCAAPEDFNGLAKGAKTVAEYGDEFIITVHTAGAAGTAKVNISSVSGAFNATNVSTTDSSGNFLVTDVSANGELGGCDVLITKPVGGALALGQAFRIRIVGDYERLSTSQVVAAGTYAGTFDTTYVATVLGNGASDSFTGAIIQVTDTAGLEPTTQVTITDNTTFPLGTQGLTLKFHGSGDMPAQGGLRVGDSYYISAKAGVESSTTFDTVILDGPAVDTVTWTNAATELHTVDFRAPFSGLIANTAHSSGTAWTASSSGIAVTSALSTYLNTRDSGYEWCAFVTAVGSLTCSYRALELVGSNTYGFVMVSDAAELFAAAGAADTDNPLGLIAQWQLVGSEGRPIFILNTGGTSAASYTAALNSVRQSTLGYEFCCANSEADVITAVQAHVVAASASTRNTQRRARFAVESPGTYTILDKQPDGSNYTATVSPYGGGNKLVTIVGGSATASLTTRGLVAGYLLDIDGGTYPIASVVSGTELLLQTGPGSAVSPAAAVVIRAADTVASQASWLKAKAESIKDRRVTLCWAERPYGADFATLPVLAGAAYVSGRRSALPAQVGLTRQNVAPFAGAHMSRYSSADLDSIASSGITILNQENQSLPVRVRHQLTTDSSGVLQIEESITVRLDVLSRRLFSGLDALLGRVNTTERAVELIRSTVLRILTSAREVATIDLNYGPLIDAFADLAVARDTTIASRVNVRVKVGLGPPLNRIHVDLDTYADIPTPTATA